MEYQADAFVQSQLFLLGLQFHVDERKLAPFGTAYQRDAISGRDFATVKQSLFDGEDRAGPELLVDWVVELEIFQILYIDDVFSLDLPTGVLVGAKFVLLVDVEHGLLGRAVHSVEAALEAGAKLLVGLLQALALLLQQAEGVVGDKCHLAAEVGHLGVLSQLPHQLQHPVSPFL